MKKKRIIVQGQLKLIAVFVCLFCFKSFAVMNSEASAGKKLFEGSSRLLNGGPACISCHNVNHSELISGGVFAKDLTKVYDRMGEGISAWLMAPPFPAMATSYKDHPLTENERNKLMEFFKSANKGKKEGANSSGYIMMLIGGFSGLGAILIWISIIWFKRKKGTVKAEIFDRQNKAWDAKF
jgi:hypothetical protein